MFKSLRNILTLSFVLVATLPIIAAGLLALKSLNVSTESQIKNKNYLIAKSLAGELERFLQEPLSLLEQIRDGTENLKIISRDELNDYLNSLVANYQFFDMIEILDRKGIILHLAPYDTNLFGADMSNQGYFREALKGNKPFWSKTFLSPLTKRPTLTLSLPMKDGVAVGHLNLKGLKQITAEIRVGAQGYSGIVDSDGTVIVHPNDKFVSERLNVGNIPLVAEGLAGMEGTLRYTFRKIKKIGSVAIVPQTQWLVAVVQTEEEAFASAKGIRNMILAGCLSAIMLAFLASFFSIKKLLGPLLQLTRNSEQITNGEYRYKPINHSSSEIANLDNAFNAMINKVKTREEHLRKEILERKQSEIKLKKAYREITELKSQIEADRDYLQEEIKLEHNFEYIIGNSDEIKYALFRLEQVAETESTVIILGETGTGKELFARALHNTSTRAARPLIKVNCATLPEQFIESELFGHVKGAYTGASKDRKGRFELAHGGTLFLDEIGELPLTLQAKLLRVLQDGEFEKLGDSRTIKTDARIITATNRDLEALVKAGKFRNDLWYRLNVFPISLPPLRNRKDDIPLLLNHFIKKIGKRTGRDISQIPASVFSELTAYDWPGNVRELEHILERTIITSQGGRLRLMDSLVPVIDEAGHDILQSHSDMERDHILRVLKQTGWVIQGPRGAAKILDFHPNTLRYRMKKLGIKRPSK